jgi:hypothetical protein
VLEVALPQTPASSPLAVPPAAGVLRVIETCFTRVRAAGTAEWSAERLGVARNGSASHATARSRSAPAG